MREFSIFGGDVEDNTAERILIVTNSETLDEAHAKLVKAREAVLNGETGPIDGVEPWETPSGAAQRLDQEIRVVEDEMLEQIIDALSQ